MMSSPPQVSMPAATKRSAKPSCVTSPLQAIASAPIARSSATVSLPGPSSRSLTTTRAPSLASFRAICRPMPRPDPETSATLPSNLPAIILLLPADPFRGAFLDEGTRAFLEIFGGAHAQPGLARQRPELGFRQVGGAAGDAEALLHRNRRIGADPAGEVERGRHHLVRRHGGIDQPELRGA